MKQERNIALCIILSIITCGLYSIYWMIVITDESIEASGEQGTSGALSFLLTLVTCGIYGLYWAYTLGQRIDKIKGSSNTGLIYLILSFVGLQIITLALAQNELNN